jgi:hypothetical protein
MCEPTTLMIMAAVTSAAGGLYAADAQANAAEYSADLNDKNAILADRRAKDAIERGQLEESRKLQEGTLLRKEQEATFSSGNVDFGFGSALDIITSSALAVDQDAALIRMNAEREAEDFELQGYNYRTQANIDRTTASNARTAGLFAAGGAILDGGAGIFKYNAGLA